MSESQRWLGVYAFVYCIRFIMAIIRHSPPSSTFISQLGSFCFFFFFFFLQFSDKLKVATMVTPGWLTNTSAYRKNWNN